MGWSGEEGKKNEGEQGNQHGFELFSRICIYKYEGGVTEEAEVVLIVKTVDGKYTEIETVVKENITYDNFIGELNVNQVNSNFESWLTGVVK